VAIASFFVFAMGAVFGMGDNEGLLGKALRFGPSKPDSVMVLFHGVPSDCTSLQDFASAWSEMHPSTQFVVFQGPHKASTPGYEWFHYHRRQLPDEPEDEYVETVILPAVRDCIDQISVALDELLDELQLNDDRLILGGFSQGAAVAAYVGLEREIAGVLLMSGPPAPIRKQLLPKRTSTRLCVITGGSDPWCPAGMLTSKLQKYDLHGGQVHIIPGLAHLMSNEHVKAGSAFIVDALSQDVEEEQLDADVAAGCRS